MARKSTRRQTPSKKRQRTKARKATPRQPPLLTTDDLERFPAPPSLTAAQTETMLRLVLEAKQAAKTELERQTEELTAPGTIGFWVSGRGDLESARRIREAAEQIRMENTKATIRARMKTPAEKLTAEIKAKHLDRWPVDPKHPERTGEWRCRKLKQEDGIVTSKYTVNRWIKALRSQTPPAST